MLYQLMNKNTVVATYCEHKDIDDFLYEEVERFDPYLPYGFIDINDWIDGRAIAQAPNVDREAHARARPYHPP